VGRKGRSLRNVATIESCARSFDSTKKVKKKKLGERSEGKSRGDPMVVEL